ncbi:MAG: hypothetical protein WB624_12965 [Xanthobacteraceae bacterium]
MKVAFVKEAGVSRRLVRAGGEAIAAIGVGGAPGGNLDEACAKAGLDKIADRLK